MRQVYLERKTSGAHELHVIKDGAERVYNIPASSGSPLLPVVCGAPWNYRRNDMSHAHYFVFEHDTWVFDGKYLLPIGVNAP